MTDSAFPPWEPPLAGTEVEHLLGALDRQRWTLRWKADGLDVEGLNFRVGVSTLTLGGLLMHLAGVERSLATVRLDGSPIGEPWTSADWDADPDWDFTWAESQEPTVLYDMYDGAVAFARDRITVAIAEGGLDQRAALGAPEFHVSLRRVLFDVLEEYARHTGHADLLREAVDGLVGEDPPEDWRPRS